MRVAGEPFDRQVVAGARRLVMRVGGGVLLAGLLLPPAAGLMALAEGLPHWTAYRGAFGATEWFSSFQLLIIAAVAWITYGARGAGGSQDGARWVWAVVAIGFAVLSLDERFDLHEALRNEVYRPLGIFVDSSWIKRGEVALFTFVAAALVLSRWVLVELKPRRAAVWLYVCALVLSVIVATLDALPDAMIQSWPAAGFWDYTAEEVGEIWTEMLFLGAFLLLLDKRLAQIAGRLVSSGALLEHLRSASFAAGLAFKSVQGEWSHQRLLEMADALIANLKARGVRPGDAVLVAGETGVAHSVAQLAVPAMGAICVPLTTPVAGGRLQWIVESTRPSVKLATSAAQLPAAFDVVRIAARPDSAILALSPARAAEVVRDVAASDWNSASPAVIRFTSGSTGQPKGVVLSHRAMLNSARMLAQRFSLDAAHRELILMSIASSGGWQRVAATLYAGGCVCFSEEPLTLPALLEDFAGFAATGFFSPPPLIRMLLREDAAKLRHALANCRNIEIGSAPLSSDEVRALLDLLPHVQVFLHYGLTECSRATVLDARRYPQRLHTTGQPLPGTSVEVRDNGGCALPAGEQGQIFVRGPQMADGYWRAPLLNDKCFRAGWLATGDYGILDAEGFLTFAGRRDDMINCAGHCFFPEEAERELAVVEGVQSYLIVGVPDPRGVLNDVPWLFAVPDIPDGWSPGLLLKQSRQRLPPHMRPRRVIAVPYLAQTPSGKPDRRGTLAQFRNTGQQQ